LNPDLLHPMQPQVFVAVRPRSPECRSEGVRRTRPYSWVRMRPGLVGSPSGSPEPAERSGSVSCLLTPNPASNNASNAVIVSLGTPPDTDRMRPGQVAWTRRLVLDGLGLTGGVARAWPIGRRRQRCRPRGWGSVSRLVSRTAASDTARHPRIGAPRGGVRSTRRHARRRDRHRRRAPPPEGPGLEGHPLLQRVLPRRQPAPASTRRTSPAGRPSSSS
jgi:hypothetical protein